MQNVEFLLAKQRAESYLSTIILIENGMSLDEACFKTKVDIINFKKFLSLKDYTSLDISVRSLGLDCRISNALQRAGCKTARDILELAEERPLVRVRNLGKSSVDRLVIIFKDKFGVDLPV